MLGAVAAVAVLAVVIAGFLAFRSGAHEDRPTLVPRTGGSPVGEATVPQVAVYETPESPIPKLTLENPWLLNDEADKPIPQVFLVEELRGDGWVRVLLPERPNGSTGWIRESDLKITQNPYRLEVKLGEHKIRVFNGTTVQYEGDVAIGKPETPTPIGKFYVRVLLQTLDPTSVYGPYAYGLSAHSEVLTEFNGGDGETGVHGNNDASVLGKSVTSGCIRMDNDEITRLSKLLPLGTPVEIVS